MLHDLRYALRTLLRAPGFSLVAIATLAVGIGINTAIFSGVNALLWRPLSIDRPEQVVVFLRGGSEMTPLSYPDYLAYRARREIFSDVAAYAIAPTRVAAGSRTALATAELVSTNYFSLLGVRPARGRFFNEQEDRAPVAVVGHRLWKRGFEFDPDLPDKIDVNGHPFTVIGVAPEGFEGGAAHAPFASAEIWLPLMARAQVMPDSADWMTDRRTPWLAALGRRAPGVSLEHAEAAVRVLDRQLGQEHPERNASLPWGVGAIALRRPAGIQIPWIRHFFAYVSSFLMTVVSLMLLVACANVANLLLARATGRRREMAVRAALGASPWRLVRELLAESLLLALAGAATGLLLCAWVTDLLWRVDFGFPPPWRFELRAELDARVFGFSLLLALVTAAAFGLAPALRMSKPDLVTALKDDAPVLGRKKAFGLRNLLVVGQVAVSVVLLVTTGVSLHAILRMQRIDPGFHLRDGLVVRIDAGLHGYTGARAGALYREVGERVRALATVRAAGFASAIPLGGPGNGPVAIEIPGRQPAPGPDRFHAVQNVVEPEFFHALGVPIVRGRGFAEGNDSPGAGGVIVNESMARRYWPDQDPIGQRIRISGSASPPLEIVGVVKDFKNTNVLEDPNYSMYALAAGQHPPSMSLLVRASGDLKEVAEAIRRELASIAPDVRGAEITTLAGNVGGLQKLLRMFATIVAVSGVLALLLAALGVYGVVAYTVAQRTREMGIRAALGAEPHDLLTLVVGEGMRPVLAGLTLGLALAFAATRLLSSTLEGLTSPDPRLLLLASLLTLSVGCLAAYLPARRASGVDPMVALRSE